MVHLIIIIQENEVDLCILRAFQVTQMVKSACNAGDLGWEDPLEKGVETNSNILA